MKVDVEYTHVLGMRMCVNASHHGALSIEVVILAEVTVTNSIRKRYSREIEHD